MIRIVPADLQEVQVQANVGNNALITDVIKALQCNHNNPVLNTACPTCVVGGNVTGLITATAGRITAKIPCPTCKGYLLYNTADGAVTPPSNPFNAPIAVTRMLPADLIQALAAFPEATTLSAIITAMRGALPDAPANNCPRCTHTGWITTKNTKTVCPTCNGWQKTRLNYSYANGRVTVIVPQIVLPNPRINPPANAQPQ